MSKLGMRTRFYLSRRSRGRKWLALLSLVFAALVVVSLAVPVEARMRVIDAVGTIPQGLAELQSEVLVGVVAGIFALLGLLILALPGYGKHTYLATSPSLIPPVSVYVDAENQLSARAIRSFKGFLMDHLDGRRADLLYFLDASLTARGEQYKTLSRFGFRPVDVPHNPTGAGIVKEAVDREIAMHAYERALLGPADQEFILVTGDGDYVPLVYRLVALGHSVQVWATHIRPAYIELEAYLEGVNVIDLKQVIAEVSIVPVDGDAPTLIEPDGSGSELAPSHANIAPPTSLTSSGEERLYWAVAETIKARDKGEASGKADKARHGAFRSALGGRLKPRLAGIGYSAGSWPDFWVKHLTVLHVLKDVPSRRFPERGPGLAEDAARTLFAMAQTAAQAAVSVVPTREDGAVSMHEVSAVLLKDASATSLGETNLLLQLVAADVQRASVHTRYFVRTARALGLLDFEDVPGTLDNIKNPRLMPTEPVPDIDTAGEPPLSAEPQEQPRDALSTDMPAESDAESDAENDG